MYDCIYMDACRQWVRNFLHRYTVYLRCYLLSHNVKIQQRYRQLL